MKCKNHADIDAVARCIGCQEAFCENCLVEMDGKKYCGDCKIMAVREKPVIEFEFETSKILCKQSRNALIYSLISIFPYIGILFGVIAISIANEAKKRIKEDPNLSGGVMASIASFLGAVMFIIWLALLVLMICKMFE